MVSNKEKATKKREKLYKQLLVHFANSKTSDEVWLNFLRDAQEAFSLPSGFSEKCLKVLPTLASITKPFNEKENKLWELFLTEKNIRNRFEKICRRNGYDVNSYNRKSDSIDLYHIDFEQTSDDPDDPNAFEAIHNGPYHVHLWEEDIGDIGMFPAIKEGKNLREIGSKVLEEQERGSISQERFKELDELSLDYSEIIPVHSSLDMLKQELSDFFDSVIKGLNYHKNLYFEDCLMSYNRIDGKLIIRENGTIDTKPVFDEEFFFEDHLDSVPMEVKTVISYCLIELLKSSYNRKLFRQCEKCQEYFFASKNDIRIKKCETCSPKSSMTKEQRRIYHRDRNRKLKEEKESRKREAKIANYMKNLGIPREEAIEIINADSML